MKNNRTIGVTIVAFFAACFSAQAQGPLEPVASFEPDWNDPRIAAAMLSDAPPPPLELDENGIPSGWVLVEGDMIVPAGTDGGIASAYETNLWPGVVPYVFDANVAAINRTEMIISFQALEAVSAVRFVPRFVEFNYVHIRDSSADATPRNSSSVGMQAGVQFFNMTNWNGNTGVNYIIVHEGGHCLGLYHEHQRPDRAPFVTINQANVQGNAFINNFPVQTEADVYGPYDFDSVMHYSRCSFAIACLPSTNCNCTPAQQTVNVNAPFTAQWQSSIGQRTHLSYWDGLVLSFLYPEPDWRFQSNSRGFFLFPGSFLAPYSTFGAGYDNTPVGGTLWILDPSTHAVGPILDKPMTIGAPLGGVTLTQ